MDKGGTGEDTRTPAYLISGWQLLSTYNVKLIRVMTINVTEVHLGSACLVIGV